MGASGFLRRLYGCRLVKLALNGTVLVESNQLDAFCTGGFFDQGFDNRIYSVEIHEPGVLAVVSFLANPGFIDRIDNGNFKQGCVKVFESHCNRISRRVHGEKNKNHARNRPDKWGEKAKDFDADGK